MVRGCFFFSGQDFTYGNALELYGNIEKLMQVANADGRVFMHYSTPREYTLARNAAQNSSGITWPLKEYSDFFPLAMPDGHSYWAGQKKQAFGLNMRTGAPIES
jgi:hypothetical protein